MPISSYAIRCAAADRTTVIARLNEMQGVTVGNETPDGIPVVTETDNTHAARELGEQLQQIPGIVSAVLVYHNFEDAD